MTITTPQPTRTTGDDAEALFKEARRRRRWRWVVGFTVAVVLSVVAAAFLRSGGGREVLTRQPPHVARHGSAAPTSQPIGETGVPLNRPEALAVSADGNLLVSNEGSNQILERLSNGTLTDFAGTGQAGFSGDNGLATEAQLNNPQGLAVSPGGTTFVADSGNNRIRSISPSGVITTVATVNNPTALAIGTTDTLYVVDDAGVQSIGAGGIVTTIIPAIGGFLPNAVAVSATGALYVSNFLAKDVLKYSGRTLKVIGHVQETYVTPAGLTATPSGAIYVGDYGWFGIDRITGAVLKPLARFTHNSLVGVGGVFRPSGVAVAISGEVYADTDGVNGGTVEPAIIEVDPDGHVHVLATGAPTT
jgi:sugar lactone lactonase YvrE